MLRETHRGICIEFVKDNLTYIGEESSMANPSHDNVICNDKRGFSSRVQSLRLATGNGPSRRAVI
jgi:hypothetical protein